MSKPDEEKKASKAAKPKALRFEVKLLDVDLIDYPDRDRPDSEMGDMEGLIRSIHNKGLIHAPAVEWDKNNPESIPTLISGYRRLTAYRFMRQFDPRYVTIPCRIFSGLKELEREQIMHEENAHREDLTWTASAIAVCKFHEGAVLLNGEDWNMSDTARALNYGPKSWSSISDRILVAKILLEPSNPLHSRVMACTGLRPAAALLRNHSRRELDNDLTTYLVEGEGAGITSLDFLAPAVTLTNEPEPDRTYIRSGKHDVHNISFDEWAQDYEGPHMHVVHLDPPYGINMDTSAQASSATKNTYDDTPADYFNFLESFRENSSNFLHPRAHVIQWFSMKFYTETLAFYAEWAAESELNIQVQNFPLIWWKSDGGGMVPDSNRAYRRVYETAFLISFGDRKISLVKNNLFDFSSGMKGGLRPHMSYKPEEMLKYFLEPLVDSSVNFLDPCVGSGSSIAAAESLGARSVTGLEIDPETTKIAIATLSKRRLLMNGQLHNVDKANNATLNQLLVSGE